MYDQCSLLAYYIHRTLKDIVRDPGVNVHKLIAFAAEFEMSVDVINNRLLGRVPMDDRFLKTFFDWCVENAPAHAESFLRSYFNCSRIGLDGQPRAIGISVDDLHKLLLRIAESVGIVAGAHVVNLKDDGQLNIFETERELLLVRTAKSLISQYESTLLRHQADLIIPKPSNNGKVHA
jgi:hypothetical protein